MSGGIREGQWDLSASEFEKTLVLIPPITEQQKIVKFLDAKCIEIDILYSDIEKQILQDCLEQRQNTNFAD